ncbi:hypothetical protein CHLRE_08g371879v5 [Chlamydomonas reinhardtii]|uniref:Uncharacterized protein n=1 Tax=Chlamydomonas reinhardtii TaxID=3055 RepID=A0A2K3DHB4_CHLRE|nr:uncharacterized protein CHLRE_08g371879v5 [Chlamydomonas reinhardtii]PNW79915.1 hypothetical protein CHLRE_08g371879v5 [Chlamydomonas reinhardtii]
MSSTMPASATTHHRSWGGDATTTTPAPLRIRPPAPAPAQHPRAATLASSKLAAPTQVPASASPPGQAARNIVPAQAAPSRVKQPTQPGSGGKAATKDDEAAPTGTSDSPATTTTDPAATHDGSVKAQYYALPAQAGLHSLGLASAPPALSSPVSQHVGAELVPVLAVESAAVLESSLLHYN